MEIKINNKIYINPFFIENEISTPDLDMNPSFSYITGDEKMLSDFINSGEVPTAKDITKDGGIF